MNDVIYMYIVLRYREGNLGCHEPARTRRDSTICNLQHGTGPIKHNMNVHMHTHNVSQ